MVGRVNINELIGTPLAMAGFAGESWVTILWVMMVTVCLTLSAIHGMVWLRERSALDSMMFALLSLFTGAIIAGDLALMRTTTTDAYAEILRWYHVPVWLAFASTIGFLRYYLQAGRLWLAGCALVIRTVTLLLNFLEPVNMNFKELTALKPVTFLGDVVATPVGVLNPLMGVGQFSLLLLLVYAIDAAVSCFRQGRKRRAIAAGGSMAVFIALASWQTALVYANVIEMPVVAGVFFLGIISVMSYELSRDILRAMQLNRDLVRERAINQAVFDGVPGMIYLYSPEGKLLRWNKRVPEESGYTEEELSRFRAADWLQGDDLNALLREWKVAMEARPANFEANLVLKGGRQVPYLLTGVRVQIDGKPHLVGMGLDISRQKQMESELQHQRRELTRMNRIATLGVLSASIAHELNQPLAAVKSNAEAGKRYLASENPDLRELREIMADIANAGSRASDVVRGLRALMRNEPAKEEPVDINDVVESVIHLVHGEIAARRVEVERELGDALPPVFGDRVQFQQVLLNLLLNAMDALEDVSALRRITIRTACVDGARVRMTVQDNGPGIAPESLSDIFTPFFTSKKSGSGMGLPICRSIVELYGGTIRAGNAADRGALFDVEFPARAI